MPKLATVVHQFPEEGIGVRVKFSPDGQYLFDHGREEWSFMGHADRAISPRICRVTRKITLAPLPTQTTGNTSSPEVLTKRRGSGMSETGQQIQRFNTDHGLNAVAISADDKLILTGDTDTSDVRLVGYALRAAHPAFCRAIPIFSAPSPFRPTEKQF